MPYAPHVSVSARGTFRDGTGVIIEQWQWGLNVGRPEGGPIVFGQDIVDGIGAAVAAFHARPTSKISGKAVLEEVRCASIGADGKYNLDPLSTFHSLAGGVAGLFLPLQVTLAVSLVTDRRGPTGRGRFYLPAPAMGIFPDARFSVADVTGIRDSVATMCTAINDQPGVDFNDQVVCVASSKGYNTPVAAVRMGRVPDTIRTRRGALDEGYTAEQAVT